LCVAPWHSGLDWNKIDGVTVNVGGCDVVQLHETLTGASPSAPVKVKLPFWQGTVEIVTACVVPGVRVPLVGLKLAPARSLATDQLAFP